MGIPFNSQLALSKSRTQTANFPAFDPESSDGEILDAYERVRALRGWAWQQDTLTDFAWPAGAEDRWDDALSDAEKSVTGTWAVTGQGIAAHLSMVLLTGVDMNDTVSRDLIEGGPLRLFYSNSVTASPEKEIVRAAAEVIHLDWENSLHAYHRSAERYAAAAQLIDAVEAAEAEVGTAGPALQALKEKIEAVEAATCNIDEINRLMKTQAPDEEEFSRKIAILMAEGMGAEALVWLARDSAFLNGRLEGATSTGEPIDFNAIISASLEA
jgi:hypothetical protein